MLDAPWAPFTVDFNLANIGGPSAGLMFSLAVVDKLSTGDLNGGKFVAGTGSIGVDGAVDPDRRHRPQDGQRARPGRRCSSCRRRTTTGPHRRVGTMELIKVETLPQMSTR